MLLRIIILNGDSPAPTRVVKGVLQLVAPITAEQKLTRKNELKARGSSTESLDQIHNRLQKLVSQVEIHGVSLSQEDVNLKFFRSLSAEWKTHTLIWRNKADLEEQSLDDLFNSLKIYEAEVKHSSSTGTTTQNLAFISSSNTDITTESVSAAASVSTVYAKMIVSSLPNVESLRLEDFFKGQEEILELMVLLIWVLICLKWSVITATRRDLLQGSLGSYDWSFQAEEEPANYALMAFSSLSSSSDNEVLSCSKACSKAYAQLHSQYDKLTADFRKSQFNVISYQTGLESIEARLLVYKQNEYVFEEDIKLLKLEVFTRAMFDCDDYLSSENDDSWPPNSLYDRFQPSDVYHVVPPLYTGTLMPPKPDLVFNTAPLLPTTPIIEDWVSDSEDESETKTPQIVPSFVQSTEQVKSPRHSVQHVETSIPAATPKPASPKPASNGKRKNRKACFVCKSLDHLIKDWDYHEKKMAQPTTRNHAHRDQLVLMSLKQVKPIITKPNSPIRRHITRSPSPKTSNSPPRVTAVKALVGNPQHALKDKGVIDSGCSRNITGNMSYLSC
nr:ribonuclease H-like domain-containing protein [Tanacetum cinerariifolium]